MLTHFLAQAWVHSVFPTPLMIHPEEAHDFFLSVGLKETEKPRMEGRRKETKERKEGGREERRKKENRRKRKPNL